MCVCVCVFSEQKPRLQPWAAFFGSSHGLKQREKQRKLNERARCWATGPRNERFQTGQRIKQTKRVQVLVKKERGVGGGECKGKFGTQTMQGGKQLLSYIKQQHPRLAGSSSGRACSAILPSRTIRSNRACFSSGVMSCLSVEVLLSVAARARDASTKFSTDLECQSLFTASPLPFAILMFCLARLPLGTDVSDALSKRLSMDPVRRASAGDGCPGTTSDTLRPNPETASSNLVRTTSAVRSCSVRPWKPLNMWSPTARSSRNRLLCDCKSERSMARCTGSRFDVLAALSSRSTNAGIESRSSRSNRHVNTPIMPDSVPKYKCDVARQVARQYTGESARKLARTVAWSRSHRAMLPLEDADTKWCAYDGRVSRAVIPPVWKGSEPRKRSSGPSVT
eukprot:m.50491 g.50491  ORF g.50491 m.50491 type:complete len:395 (+) comp6546_c0_seq1:44-1228(+)